MSSFAKSSFNAVNYLSARPNYPESLFKYIHSYFKTHNPNLSSPTTCVDIGCGPGEATSKLSNYFSQTIGIDPSPKMIEAATSSTAKSDHLTFIIGSDKSFSDLIPPQSADIITSAQAVHWFDFPQFLNSAYNTLKPNGTLALWGYVDHIFIDHPKASEITLRYTYGDEFMGPYWEQPGRGRLRNMLIEAESHLNSSGKFSSIEAYRNDSINVSNSFYEMTKTVPLRSVQDYMKTASAYHEWKLHHPNDRDVTDLCFEAIKAAENWSDDTEVTIKWATILLLATRMPPAAGLCPDP